MPGERPMSSESSRALIVLRRSHDRLAAKVAQLDSSSLRRRSYSSEWSIAQVLSHLGSQAEIFGLLFEAGLTGGDPPGQESFPPIWDAWNARSPEDQAANSIAANDAFLRRIEALDASQLDSFRLSAFGMDIDAPMFLRMRISEHAVHAWDIFVVLDQSATVAPDAVELLVDALPDLVARVGKPMPRAITLRVSTVGPERTFALVTDGVRLEPWSERGVDGALQLSAEELVRLVYGRLDSSHAHSVRLDAPGMSLDDLRAMFPGL
jgi:uncharacterized protein (TIGR03083 family)